MFHIHSLETWCCWNSNIHLQGQLRFYLSPTLWAGLRVQHPKDLATKSEELSFTSRVHVMEILSWKTKTTAKHLSGHTVEKYIAERGFCRHSPEDAQIKRRKLSHSNEASPRHLIRRQLCGRGQVVARAKREEPLCTVRTGVKQHKQQKHGITVQGKF